MISGAKGIASQADMELAVATVSNLSHSFLCYNISNVTYYVLPYGKGNLIYNSDYENYWRQIKQDFNPDVVHIHGTEFTHGLSYVRACGTDNVVVSIQGLLSVIYRYSLGGLNYRDVVRNITVRDIISHTSLFDERNNFKRRSKYEIELLQSVHHIIGRTRWDKVHSMAIAKDSVYYNVNESLRDAFYQGAWSYDNCSKHTIFLSQGSSALKGAHWVFKALPLVLRSYPDTKIRIAGKDIVSCPNIRNRLCQTNYGKYLSRLIKSEGIEDRIEYLGVLSEHEMKREYLSANLFICPSSIENSPNSLGEAQILGVPCIASYAGGIPDFMRGELNKWMYRFDDPEMLAELICDMFEFKENVDFSQAKLIALERHNREKNMELLISVYRKICGV